MYRSSSAHALAVNEALREAMNSPITDGDAVEVPPAPPPTAGALSPEGVAPKRVAADASVLDGEPESPYGDRVQQERARQSRLSRWQAQRS